MNRTTLCMFSLALGLLCSTSLAQIGNPYRAEVQGYFGDANDSAQLSTPGTLPPWTGPGATLGPYGISGVPLVPGPSALPQYVDPFTTVLLPTSNNLLPGYIWAPPAITLSGTTINNTGLKYVGMTGTNVSDAAAIPRFTFNNTSSLNAYTQFNFEIDYTYNGLLAGGTASSPTLFVSYNTSSYAQFAGNVRYYWNTINSSGDVTPFGNPWTYLGSVDYNWSITGSSSGINIPVSPLSTSSLGAAPAGGGILALVGNFYVAGDPAFIEVQAVPEPSTLTFGGLAVLSLIIVAKRRKKHNLS
jgi:hypothetical protein